MEVYPSARPVFDEQEDYVWVYVSFNDEILFLKGKDNNVISSDSV